MTTKYFIAYKETKHGIGTFLKPVGTFTETDGVAAVSRRGYEMAKCVIKDVNLEDYEKVQGEINWDEIGRR